MAYRNGQIAGLGIDPELLDLYGQGSTGTEHILAKLRGAYRHADPTNALSKRVFFGDNFGQDITNLFNDFNAWAERTGNAQLKTRREFKKYADADAASPGRKQTILVPGDDVSKVILGGSASRKQSAILGGY